MEAEINKGHYKSRAKPSARIKAWHDWWGRKYSWIGSGHRDNVIYGFTYKDDRREAYLAGYNAGVKSKSK